MFSQGKHKRPYPISRKQSLAHCLLAAVRQKDGVGPPDAGAVRGLTVGEVCARLVVPDGVCEVVRLMHLVARLARRWGFSEVRVKAKCYGY